MKKSTLKTILWTAGIPVLLIATYLVVINLMLPGTNGGVPSDLDYSTTRVSDHEAFQVSYTSSEVTVPVNKIHQWRLHVETLDGQPIENAIITVDSDMAQHGHGLPTHPQVTKNLGHRNYLVDGMKFQMRGWWLMDFTISVNGQTDAATLT